MDRNKIRRWVLVGLSCALTTVSVVREWTPSIRWIFVLSFLLFSPGAAFAHFLPGADRLTRTILVVLLSLSLVTAITELYLYLRIWSPLGILMTLIGVCAVGLISEVLVASVFARK